MVVFRVKMKIQSYLKYISISFLTISDEPAELRKGNLARMLARAGTNMTLACPGLSPTSYVYLVEWKCLGCKCTGCPNPNGEGTRILRFNDELTRWDTAARDEVQRRTLDIRSYGLQFGPVKAEDSGTYLCLINNRREPDALLELTVEGNKKRKKSIYLFSTLKIS